MATPSRRATLGFAHPKAGRLFLTVTRCSQRILPTPSKTTQARRAKSTHWLVGYRTPTLIRLQFPGSSTPAATLKHSISVTNNVLGDSSQSGTAFRSGSVQSVLTIVNSVLPVAGSELIVGKNNFAIGSNTAPGFAVVAGLTMNSGTVSLVANVGVRASTATFSAALFLPISGSALAFTSTFFTYCGNSVFGAAQTDVPSDLYTNLQSYAFSPAIAPLVNCYKCACDALGTTAGADFCANQPICCSFSTNTNAVMRSNCPAPMSATNPFPMIPQP